MINIPQGNKGETVTASFDLGQLLGSALIEDAYFQDYHNIKEFVVNLVSPEGQPAVIKFTVPEIYDGIAEINALFRVHPTARDEFSLSSIRLFDFQNDAYVVTLSTMQGLMPSVVDEFNVSF